MRLINVETYALESFTNVDASEGVRYAILSHTWEGEEVTFQEMQDRDAERHHTKAGFSKIRQTCQQAIADGLKYVWVDTCCIDKTSSAELQEAINSMFKWYAGAAQCYAYLCDVTLETDEDYELNETDSHNCISDDVEVLDVHTGVDRHSDQVRHSMSSRIGGSRWFTRGWTLQELIAPKTLHFFDRRWSPLGTRDQWNTEIAKHTGIDSSILRHGILLVSATDKEDMRQPLSTFSVANRMSWAAFRKTTRLEDEAYALLGIFGIHIPLLYGEGAAAFTRLQEEILRTSADLSILLWRPYRPLRGFLGHQGLLAFSPRGFRHCRSIDYVLTQRLFETLGERTISPIGMKARMLIGLDTPEHGTYIYLGCYDEQNPTHTIVLKADLEFTLSDSPAMADDDTPHSTTLFLLPDHGFSRIAAIDALDVESEVVIRDVMFTRAIHGYTRPRTLADPISTPVKCVWVRGLFNDATWVLSNSYPEKSWDLRQLTFDPARASDNVIQVVTDNLQSARFATGSLTLRLRGSTSHCHAVPDSIIFYVVITIACLVPDDAHLRLIFQPSVQFQVRRIAHKGSTKPTFHEEMRSEMYSELVRGTTHKPRQLERDQVIRIDDSRDLRANLTLRNIGRQCIAVLDIDTLLSAPNRVEQ